MMLIVLKHIYVIRFSKLIICRNKGHCNSFSSVITLLFSVSANQLCKTISTLLNPKIPLIKKRQLMSAYCGDYREKMAKEDKKIRLGLLQ